MKKILFVALLVLVCNGISAQKGNYYFSLTSGTADCYKAKTEVLKGERWDGGSFGCDYKYGMSNRFLLDASIGIKSSDRYASTYGAALGVNTILLNKEEAPTTKEPLGFETNLYLITDGTYTGYAKQATKKRHFGGRFGLGGQYLLLGEDKEEGRNYGFGFTCETGYETSLEQIFFTFGLTLRF